MKLKFLVMMSLLLTLSACVEFKNTDQDNEPTAGSEPEKPVVVQTIPSLVVETEMFLFEDQILTREQFQQNRKMPQPNSNLVYPFENLEIKKGAVLYTLGQTVRLEVKNLISDGSIATFPENWVADEYQDGRSGGHIDLVIENAKGFLFANLRGERGGKGNPGKDFDENLRGEKGQRLGLNDCSNQAAIQKWYGGRGKSGYNGDQGKKGGNSGSLNITVASYDPHTFSFDFDRKPGVGGIGGDPSMRGGERGYNGDTICIGLTGTKVTPNPDFIGGPGVRGLSGIDGKDEPVCEIVNGNKSCR